MALIYLFINVIICFFGVKHAKKIKSLFLLWWGYIFYYAILYYLNCRYASSYYIEWFSYNKQNVSIDLKLEYYGFVTLTNLIIFLVFKFYKKRRNEIQIVYPKDTTKLSFLYTFLMLCSFGFLINKLSNFSYQDLTSSVDFGGWSWVFVQVSMSLIVLAYIKNNKKLTGLIFFLSLGYTLVFLVRSIFIYSVLSLLYLYLLKSFYVNLSLKQIIKKLAIPILVLGFFTSLAVTLRGFDEITLPDSKLADFSLTIYKTYKTNSALELNDFKSFSRGVFSPIGRFLEQKEELLTTPIANARVLFTGDVHEVNFESFFHYPSLFYNQFYSSFKWWGVLLGAVLVFYVMSLERFVTKNFLTLFLFLPIFSWHVFMIFRGALDLSTSGISYALWINIIIYLIIKRNKFLYARFTSNK